jgi:hypothetical protein
MDAWSESESGEKILGVKPEVFYVAIGLLLAPVFTLTPFLGRAAWVLTAIVHEAGHTAIDWALGCPAVPVLNLFEHGAATMHQQQVPLIAYIVWASLGVLLIRAVMARAFIPYAVVLVVLYPLLAFNERNLELMHLLGGHLGEIAAGAVCLWHAQTGHATHDNTERALYAGVGWYLLFNHAWLCFGLGFVPAVQRWYEEARSFGIANDYTRAGGLLGVEPGSVALVMLGLTVLAAVASLTSRRWLRI